MNIGELIKRKRLEQQMNQSELAKKSGVDQSMISRLENGASGNVSVDILRKLAKALNCPVIDLLPETDKKTP